MKLNNPLQNYQRVRFEDDVNDEYPYVCLKSEDIPTNKHIFIVLKNCDFTEGKGTNVAS